MEKLEFVANRHIGDQMALKVYLKYCKVHCGWLSDSPVDVQSVETCLDNFKKDHPEFAQYVS